MSRDLPLGNGSLLVNFDSTYQLRDLYWPHVGLENHTDGHVFRVGMWVDGVFVWMDDPRWVRHLRYDSETLVTQVTVSLPDFQATLNCQEAVDFHENLLLRRFEVGNPTDSAALRMVCPPCSALGSALGADPSVLGRASFSLPVHLEPCGVRDSGPRVCQTVAEIVVVVEDIAFGMSIGTSAQDLFGNETLRKSPDTPQYRTNLCSATTAYLPCCILILS